MNMEQFNKMLEMAQSNPQMLAMLQQTLNKGAEQQKMTIILLMMK